MVDAPPEKENAPVVTDSLPMTVDVVDPNVLRQAFPDFQPSLETALHKMKSDRSNIIFYLHDSFGLVYGFEINQSGEITRIPFIHTITTRAGGERSNPLNNLTKILDGVGFFAQSDYVNARIYPAETDLTAKIRSNEFTAESLAEETKGDRYALKLWNASKAITDSGKPESDEKVGFKTTSTKGAIEDVRVDFTPKKKISLFIVLAKKLDGETKAKRIEYYRQNLLHKYPHLQVEFS
jgi:hypothetical protein